MATTRTAPARWGRRALLTLGSVVGVLVLGYGVAFLSTGSSQLARAIIWLDADVGDIDRFPSREIVSTTASDLPIALDGLTAEAAARIGPNMGMQGDFDSFLTDTETTSFLVVRDGTLIYEWYADGVEHETLQTSFSVSKSFLGTLIGLAIDDGSIGSIADPITDYIPELLERDPRFADITLQHLMTMSSGLAYVEEMTPWSDAANTYYSPDLRATALDAVIEEAPGQTFLYNNYNPLLLGMALERATGESVTDYMSRVLWAPMGAEADASWSLDSTGSGFEKMESGLNARAIDFARFGLLMANGGAVEGTHVVPQEWVAEATAVDTSSDPADNYQYFWWVYPPHDAGTDSSTDFAAQGNFGQYIYVVPDENTVIVRLGSDEGGVAWPWLMSTLARDIGAQAGQR